jgi:putative ABC transport system ATP-binding protein
MSGQTIIETIDLKKIYGVGDATVSALDGVSIHVEAGEFVAIMGPSGSGKSTLMNILGCLSRPSSGSYILDGQDVSSLDMVELATIRNRKIGYVFQSYNLLSHTTAIRNVILPLQYDRDHKRTLEEQELMAREMLVRVGLSERMNHEPQELSGGQQQRVAIARALVNDPVLIMADEPTGNLDSQSSVEIMGLLQKLHERGGTIVMVTHDPDIAAFTERTIHLRDGKVDNIVNNGIGMHIPEKEAVQ